MNHPAAAQPTPAKNGPADLPPAADLLLAGARVPFLDEPVDVALAGGRIASIVPAGTGAAFDGETVRLDDRFLHPGLWDEHVHFRQWSLVRQRLDLSGAGSAAEVATLVAGRLASGPLPASGRIEGYGFRDGLWPDAPTVARLDEISREIPIVLVSGDLHCAWLNTAGLALIGQQGVTETLLRETDWMPYMARLDDLGAEATTAFVADAAEAAAARGVVGVVDFETQDNVSDWAARVAAGITSLRVDAAIWPWLLEDAIALGRRSGEEVPGTGGLVRVGPFKAVVDGSLNTRTGYCHDPYPGMPEGPDAYGVLAIPADELRAYLRRASANGISAAVHAIGDHATTIVLDAFAEVGIAGSVEHAQLVRASDFGRFAELGLVASVQPEHAMDDRDVADRHWAGRTDRAFAYGSLLASGARLKLGSDAPVSLLDPWVQIAAAANRARDGREPWHPAERIPLDIALASSARGGSEIRVGAPADLVITDADPFTADDATLRAMPVSGTLLAGRWTHRKL